MTTLTHETQDPIRDRPWDHYRATISDTEALDFVVDVDGNVLEVRGFPQDHPELFTAVPRPDFDDGTPRRPAWRLADGVVLPT